MLQFICIFVNIFFLNLYFISIFHGEPLFGDDFVSVISEAEPETIYCIVERYISYWGGHEMNIDTFL